MALSSDYAFLESKLKGLQKLIDLAPDLVFLLDRKLRYLYVNQRVLDVTGLTREQYLGKTNRELKIPKELCDFWDKTYLNVFRDGQLREIEFVYPSTQGPRH